MNASRVDEDDKIYYETEGFLSLLISEAPPSSEALRSRLEEVHSDLTPEEQEELLLLSFYISRAVSGNLKMAHLEMCLSPDPYASLAVLSNQFMWASEDLYACLGYETGIGYETQQRIDYTSKSCQALKKSNPRSFGRIVQKALKVKSKYGAPTSS